MESEYALAIPNVRRAKRATARRDVCVVVDNGSHELRAGFAGDADPCLRFPNQLIRPRSRWSTEFETVVGECQFNVKGFDFGRAAVRSAFDGNVVVNFDTQEAILDYVFDRMGFQESMSRNPIVMTECVLNPVHSRKAMMELLFESYGVPSVVFIPDCLAAFGYNRNVGNYASSTVIVSSGHSATHIVPVVDNQAHLQYAQRSKMCGSQATLHLQQLTMLHNPQCAASLSRQTVELMKEQCTYCSQDYVKDLAAVADESTAEGLGLKIQLPKTANGPGSVLEGSAEQIVDKAAKAEEQRMRLKAMSMRRREKMISEKEDLLLYLRDIQRQIAQADSEDVLRALFEDAEVESTKELNKLIENTNASLQRLLQPETNPVQPDVDPTPEEATMKKEEDLESMRERYRTLSERLEQRKRGRFGLDRDSGPSSKRVSSEQRRRMKLVAEAAAKDDKDDFGADDRDWDVYKEMDPSQATEAEAHRQDEAELRVTMEKLQQMGEIFEELPMDVCRTQRTGLLDESQVYLSVERIRVPELLFQPSLMGIDQAGIPEIVSRVLKSLPENLAGRVDQEIFLCGGNVAYAGLATRLEAEMRSLRPYGRPMRVVSSQDWFLDAWRGAAHFAQTMPALHFAYTYEEYKECGPHGLQRKPIPFVYYM